MTTFVQELATLDGHIRDAYLDTLNAQELQDLLYTWSYWARPEQLTPPGDWNVWLYLAGRGAGKTRTDAEDVKAYGLTHPESRIAIVAPTYGDGRDTCIEGVSGLLSVLPPGSLKTWNRSLGELVLKNGTHYKLFSAEEPERLRGPQHHRAWCEELCAWQKLEDTWDNLMFGLRLGIKPQTVISTTPKPSKFLSNLLKRADVFVTRGSTFDNTANLAPSALAQLKERYLGTRTGRQELYAEILEDNEGALWKREAMIEAHRVTAFPDLVRVGVAIDPAVTNTPGSDETGIIAGGVAENGHAYILADASLKASPMKWAEEAVSLYHKVQADRMIAEGNQGGELIETTIRTVDTSIAFTRVHATRGKYLRAEPVAALYERGLVHHVGCFPTLEDEQCNWVQGNPSPNHLDALVWLLTDLLLDGKEGGMILGLGNEDETSPFWF